jgi:hypothetical protein
MEHNSYELKTLGLLNQRNSLKFPVFTFFSDLKQNPDGLLWSQTTYLTKNLRLSTGTTRHGYANGAELKKSKTFLKARISRANSWQVNRYRQRSRLRSADLRIPI